MIRKIPWRITTVIMFAVCAVTLLAMMSNGLMEMSNYIIFNVATGTIALLGIMMLCLAYSMDSAPKDESSSMFYQLLILTYIGILSDNYSWFVDGNTNLIWVKATPHKDHLLDFVRILLASFPSYRPKTP